MQRLVEGRQLWHKRDGYLADMPPGKLRFLQRVTEAPPEPPRWPKTAEELTVAENIEAIKAAVFVIVRSAQLIAGIGWRRVRSYFDSMSYQSRAMRWAQLGTSAGCSAVAVQLSPFIFG